MKKLLTITALCVITFSAFSCASTSKKSESEKQVAVVEGFNGVRFSTANVVEEFEVGESGHYVTYDDADAGLYDEVIRLTPSAYVMVLEAIGSNKEIEGTLKAVKSYETTEYELTEVVEWKKVDVSKKAVETKPVAHAKCIDKEDEAAIERLRQECDSVWEQMRKEASAHIGELDAEELL